MAFSVTGYVDGVSYTLLVGVTDPEVGVIRGSRNIVDYLERREGKGWDATPTGPYGRLDIADPRSVLGALMGWTQVIRVEGQPPDILEGASGEPGTVY